MEKDRKRARKENIMTVKRRKKRRWMRRWESPSTKKKRKITQRKEKVDEAAMTKLPYLLAEKGPLYKGVDALPGDNPECIPSGV